MTGLRKDRTDLVGHLEDLGFLPSLGLLERRFQTRQDVLRERRCRRDDNVQFSPILRDQLIESFNHPFCLSKSTILGENREQVFGDIRKGFLPCAFELGKELRKGSVAFVSREGGVVDEGAYLWVLGDGGGDGGKVCVDLGEGLRRF